MESHDVMQLLLVSVEWLNELVHHEAAPHCPVSQAYEQTYVHSIRR
jgi:hypothetical protein